MQDWMKTMVKKAVQLWLLAAVVIVGIEVLCRGWADTFQFIGTYPLAFLVNTNRMALISLPALLCTRTVFVALLIELPWVIAAMANRMLMVMRGTPFIWADLRSVGEGASLLGDYLTWGLFIEIALFVVVGVVVLVLSYKKLNTPATASFLKRLGGVAVVALVLLGVQWLCHPDVVMVQEAMDAGSGYERNGFLYTFTSDMDKFFGGQGSQEDMAEVDAIFQQLKGEETTEPTRTPNIIVIQLEAAFDPYRLGEELYSEDPIPNLHKAMANGYSGELGVHTFGGGTARTEFAVLTGMNMDFISDGIPFTDGTVKDDAIESMAYILKDKGYRTTALHNHFAHFFDRNLGYNKLGFDTFITKETMYPVEHQFGWAKDEVFFDYIKRVLESSEEKDFIFGISVATHGPYPTEHEGLDYGIEIKGEMEASTRVQFEKYIDRLHHLDILVGELVDYVQNLEEDTILVLYADHGPTLEVLQDWTREEKFTSFYTIIDNQNKLPKAQHQFLYDYHLYPKLFEMLGIEDGIMNKMHQNYWEDEAYETYFRGIQNIVLNGLSNLEPTAMRFGMEPVVIESVKKTPEGLEISGSGFTECSKMLVDEKPVETTFISPTTLLVPGQSGEEGKVEVGQIGMKDKVLVTSNVYEMK